MNFSWWTFALQAANFLILVWLLQRFLFKPISALVARRKQEIARLQTEAAAEKENARKISLALEAQRAGIEAERLKALDAQRAQFAVERNRLLEEARTEADQLLKRANAKLDEERTAAAEELFSRTTRLASELAERLLSELALPSLERPFLPRILDYLDRLSTTERASLVAQLEASPLTVTTAHPLDPDEEREWREGLEKRIGDAVTIRFSADPLLIAGARILFPHGILRFNWRDSLNAAAGDLHHHEHAA